LQSLAIRGAQAVELDSHLIAADDADHRAHSGHGPGFLPQLHAQTHLGAGGEGAMRLDQDSIPAHVHGFRLNILASKLDHYFLHNGHASHAPLSLFDQALRGPHSARQAVAINRFAKKQAGAGLKSHGERAGALIVADHNNRGGAVRPRLVHLASKLRAVRRRHVKIQEHEIKSPSPEKSRRLRTAVQDQGVQTLAAPRD
jgi:hypothetical protein